MKPDETGVSVVNYGCDNPDCDFGGEERNGVGLAAQHAESTGHPAFAEQITNMWWNTDAPGGLADRRRGDDA